MSHSAVDCGAAWPLLPPGVLDIKYSLLLKQLLAARALSSKRDVSLAEGLCQMLREQFLELYPGYELTLTGSGTEALLELFANGQGSERRPTIYLSAFTCPDLLTAAAAASCIVVPLDVDERTIEIAEKEWAEVESRSAIVLSNLYGLADSLPPADILANTKLIDDACQAALSLHNGTRVGARANLGVLSFGRGKALASLGGGAILTKGESATQSSTANHPLISREVRSLGQGVLTDIFEHPLFYRIPASMPFLHIGETVVKSSVPTGPFTFGSALWLSSRLLQLESHTQVARDNAQRWCRALDGSAVCLPSVVRYNAGNCLLRFPCIFPSEASAQMAYNNLRRIGVGASRAYSRLVYQYSEFSEIVRARPCPGAERLLGRCLTLPLHRYVTESVIERAGKIIRSSL